MYSVEIDTNVFIRYVFIRYNISEVFDYVVLHPVPISLTYNAAYTQRKEMFYLMTHSTHFTYCYMVSVLCKK